jgi:hypothetical protein
VAAFSFRGACQVDGTQWAPLAAFTGPRDVLRTHEHRQGHAVLLATFTAVGAHAFLRSPLDEVAGSTVSLADLIGRPDELRRLTERLNTAENHWRRIALVEQFLLAGMCGSTPDPLISAAVPWLESGATRKRIADLARYIGISQSALERRFKRSSECHQRNSLPWRGYSAQLSCRQPAPTLPRWLMSLVISTNPISSKNFSEQLVAHLRLSFGDPLRTPNSYNYCRHLWPRVTHDCI